MRKTAVILFLFFCAFVISMRSPQDIFTSAEEPNMDSSVFQYVAWMMKNGAVPYRDTFDHKGLLLYVINLAGMMISAEHGIWIVELAVLFISLYGMYRIACMDVGWKESVLVTVVVFSLMAVFFEGGNFAEEYALPFEIWSLYIYLKYFRTDSIASAHVVLCGFLLSCVFFIRANMISVWAVCSIMVVLRCLYRKEYRELGRFTILFFAGFLLLAVPILVYLVTNHALRHFVQAYILFNGQYVSSFQATAANKVSACLYYAGQPVVLLSLIAQGLVCVKSKTRFLDCGYLVYMLVTIGFTGMSGMTFGHYGMMLLPMLGYPLAQLLKMAEGKQRVRRYLVSGLCVLMIIGWSSLGKRMVEEFARSSRQEKTGYYWNMIQYIQTYTAPTDRITVYGNHDSIYLYSQRYSASRYSYQSPIRQVDEKIADAYFDEISRQIPRMVIMDEHELDERMSRYLEEHGFVLNERFGSDLVYEYPY